MKKIFTLIALCLSTVVGAMAADIEWETVWSADFSSTPSGMTYSVSNGSTNINAGYLEYVQGGGSGNRAINTAFTASAFNVETAWKMEFDIAFSSSNQNDSYVTFATNEGSVFTATWIKYAEAVVVKDASSEELTNSLPLEGYNKSTMNSKTHVILTGDPEKGVYLTMKQGSTTYVDNVLATETFGYPKTLNGSLGRAVSHMMLDNIVFQTPKVAGFVAAPTFNVIGANGNARILTLATITEGADMKWSETAPATGETFESWTSYNGTSLSTSASTIYAVAIKGSDKSEVSTIETGAGSTLSLVAPVVSVSLNDGVPTYSFVSNNSAVLGAPSATLSAKLDGETVSLTNNTLTPSVKGTLVVTASATGYTDASTTIKVSNFLAPVWSSTDYSTLTEENAQEVLGENWKMSTGGRWASWNAGNEPYTYFGDGSTGNITVENNLRMRGVINLVLGYGLGRNVTSGEAITMNGMQEGYIATYKMYNGYGSSTAASSNYTIYALATGTSTSVNTNNGALLIQAVMYAPAPTSVPVTISDAGYATFVAPYDVDFTGNDIEAFAVSAVDAANGKVTLTNVTQVRAGEAVIVKGATGTVNVVASAEAITNLMKAAKQDIVYDSEAANTNYVLANGVNGVGLYPVTSGTIDAGKGYLPVAVAKDSGSKPFIGLFDNATDAGVVEAAPAVVKNGKYTENGQIVIFINGKKYNVAGMNK